MRILFLAYCMINNENGDSLIGVYKRCLRVAAELTARGHEIWIHCTGRHLYRDAFTEACEDGVRFLDFLPTALLDAPLQVRRRYFRRILGTIRPDMVVVGEAPMAGTLLDITLCAIGLEIRTVVLDNAYDPGMARLFLDLHGALADGVVLTGLSSCHPSEPPSFYCPAPPYVAAARTDRRNLASQLDLDGRKLITVLGYEEKAERLMVSLLPHLASENVTVFLSRDPAATEQRLKAVARRLRESIRVWPQPTEEVLFGLLETSNLVIGKCGFMQVTESLALGAPFIGVYYRGCFDPAVLHATARQFVHATRSTDAQPDTIEAATRFLHTDRSKLATIHDGRFGAASATADFLERLPSSPRRGTTQESRRLGYPHELVLQAVRALRAGQTIHYLGEIRAGRLRNLDHGTIDCVTCVYEAGGVRRQATFCGRTYLTPAGGKRGEPADPDHQVLAWSHDMLKSLEMDPGEASLPPLAIA